MYKRKGKLERKMALNRSEYAISTWIMDHYPLDEALNQIHRYGFDNVEIWADIVQLDPRLNPDIAAIARLLKANGQRVHSVHSPFRNPFPHPEEEEAFRRYRMDLWRKTLEFCNRLESDIMVIHAVERNEYNYPLSQAQIVKDCLGQLVAYGRPLGVQVALENIAPSRTNNPAEIACTLQEQTALFGGIGLKYCLDIAHAPLCGVDACDEADVAMGDLVSFHISNNDGVHDDHALPFDGILDWNAIHDHVREAGYQGEFVLELFGGEDQLGTLARAAKLFED